MSSSTTGEISFYFPKRSHHKLNVQWYHDDPDIQNDANGPRSDVRDQRPRYSSNSSAHPIISNADTMDLRTGHYYLTTLLLPALLAVPHGSNNIDKARVVTVSSSASYFATYDFNTFRDGPARRRLSPTGTYAQSKWVRCSTGYSSEFYLGIDTFHCRGISSSLRNWLEGTVIKDWFLSR